MTLASEYKAHATTRKFRGQPRQETLIIELTTEGRAEYRECRGSTSTRKPRWMVHWSACGCRMQQGKAFLTSLQGKKQVHDRKWA